MSWTASAVVTQVTSEQPAPVFCETSGPIIKRCPLVLPLLVITEVEFGTKWQLLKYAPEGKRFMFSFS